MARAGHDDAGSGWLLAGSLLGAAAVAGGAFGAHGLADVLAAAGHADTWETGARYAMHHALALVAVGLRGASRGSSATLNAAGWCFLAGTLIFSGCLAALSLTGLRVLGAIVPIGGTLLIVGWLCLARDAAAAAAQSGSASAC
ncbi:MAG: DUF423 domain-containing protein [Pirellulales bacterium]